MTKRYEKIDKSFFDEVHDRTGTGAIKYDVTPGGVSYPDMLPLWVADMDFKAPPAVTDALVSCARHGIFGYTDLGEEYGRAVTDWFYRRMGLRADPSWIVKAPGVVFSMCMAIRALCAPGDAVLICQPVYHPFAKIIPANGRRLAVTELVMKNGRYEIDFGDFEDKIKRNNVKLFLLCSPHNPVSRVWTRAELEKMAEICRRHGVLVVSDEIHSDFVYEGHTHIPFASLSSEVSDMTVTCTAPSKTFNLAGLQAANMLIENKTLRERVRRECLSAGYGGHNVAAACASLAAYKHGEQWLEVLLSYLSDNVGLLSEALDATNGKVTLIRPEGTYLMWLDCRALSMTDEELDAFFLKSAGLYLNSGYIFGRGGSGFMRMNIACPKETLDAALGRLSRAVSKL
ncbi:MAG: pyridoxal phosphate-dependent aminotransferase [Clostridia bacterium]|nr:pyridoxal phosphate-dependent aminotransferase [Clostridia bacterium]